MNEMKICDYALVDLLMYAPPSIPYDAETVVTKDGSVKMRSDLNNVTFTFEGDGIIRIADKSGEHQITFDTHAWYCRNVAAKDMLQHLVNRYNELTERYNRLNEAVDQMIAQLSAAALGEQPEVLPMKAARKGPQTFTFQTVTEHLLKDKPSK